MTTPEQVKAHSEKVGIFANKYATSIADIKAMDVVDAYREMVHKKLKSLVAEAARLRIPFSINITEMVEDMVREKFRNVAPVQSEPNPFGQFFPSLESLHVSFADLDSDLCFGHHDLGDAGYRELTYVRGNDGNWYGRYASSYGDTEYLADEPTVALSY